MDSLPDGIKILIGLVIAVFWIIGKIAEIRKQRQEEQRPGPDWEPDSETYHPDEDDYGNPLPPPMPQRHAPPPLPQFIPASHSELERQQRMQELLRAAKKEMAAASAPAARSRRQAPTAKKEVPVSGIGSRLKNRSELRRAIVMREILDPPVGLR